MSSVLFRVLAATILLLAAARADANELAGTWVSQYVAIQFNADGTFAWQDPNQALAGQYQVSEGQLQMATGGYTIHYAVALQGNMLQLTDPQGASMVFQRYGASPGATDNYGQAAARPQGTQTQQATRGGTGLSASPGTDAYFMQFMQSFPQMHPDQLVTAFSQLSQSQRQMVAVFPAVENRIHLQMCQGSYANQIVYNNMNCQQLMAQYQESWQMGFNPDEYPEQQRQTLLIHLQCQAGQIDAGSCAAYGAATQSYAQGSAQTSQTIIDNMAPQCTHYYEQGTNAYLGCW